ncbi:MAG: type II secretion system protein [Candidatus Sacchiramonaceae bacterium]|nr:type II secretion system protein [Candidatus Saccharimonadaceae bacterium]
MNKLKLDKTNNKLDQPAGFTIIEVVLVLAIAGLIFLMVFIALPALQRSQRNTQYKNNVAIAVGMVQNYKSNNRGNLPTYTGENGLKVGSPVAQDHPFYSYVQNSNLPEDVSVKVLPHRSSYVETDRLNMRIGRIIIMPNAECAADSKPFEGQLGIEKAGSVGVITVLEEGNGMVYCQNV